MKLQDVINQIRLVFPKHSALLSESFIVTSIVATATTATITTGSTVGLSGDESLTISNVAFKNGLATVSQDGLVFTFTTAEDHDLTFGWEAHDLVNFEGFTDDAWNTSFKLISVPNRKTFSVQSVNTLPVLNGSEKLLEIRDDGVNGRFQPVPGSQSEFTVNGSFLVGDYTGGAISGAVRVAGAIDSDTALSVYTKQNTDKLWLYVVPNDVDISKDRSSLSDATSTKSNGDDMRLRMLDGFTVHAFLNSSSSTAGVTQLDILKDELMLPLLQTLFGARFDTGLSGGPDFRAVLKGSGVSHYDKALLGYAYSFEVAMDLTNDDAVNQGDTRAFRDIDYTQTVDTQDMTVNINLDEVPLDEE